MPSAFGFEPALGLATTNTTEARPQIVHPSVFRGAGMAVFTGGFAVSSAAIRTVRDRLQMGRVDTSWITTEMVNIPFLGELTTKQQPCGSAGGYRSPSAIGFSDAENAIARLGVHTQPRPAFIRSSLVDLAKQTLLRVTDWLCHITEIITEGATPFHIQT